MTPSLNDEELNTDTIMKKNENLNEIESTTSSAITTTNNNNNLKRKNIDNDDEESTEAKNNKTITTRKTKQDQKLETTEWTGRSKTRQTKSVSSDATSSSSSSSSIKTRSHAAREASKISSLNNEETSNLASNHVNSRKLNNFLTNNKNEITTNDSSTKALVKHVDVDLLRLHNSKLSPFNIDEPCEKKTAQIYTNDQNTENWLSTFKEMPKKSKQIALEKILELCEHSLIKHIHNYIEPKLQRDYISELPRELILLLLTYVRPKDLNKLAQVSHYWHQIANDPIIWKNICKRNKIDIININTSNSDHKSNSLNNSNKFGRLVNSKCSYGLVTNQVYSQNTSNDHIDVSSKFFRFYDDNDYLDPNDLENDMAGVEYDENDKIDDNELIEDEYEATTSARSNKKCSSSSGTSSSTGSSSNGYCSPSSPSSHSSEPNLAKLTTSADQDHSLKSNNSKQSPSKSSSHMRETIKRRRQQPQSAKYSSNIKSIISKTINSVCNSNDNTNNIFKSNIPWAHTLPFTVKTPLNTVLESFNKFKRAYLIDFNVTKNWCTRTLPRPFILRSHDDHVITCLKFDGYRVVSGSDDCTLKVWCALTSKLLQTLVGHTGGVWASQLKDNIVISGSTDRSVRVWNIDTGECIHILTGHTSTVRCLALNGNIVVSGSRDSLLRVWNIETGQCMHILRGHVAAVRCVCFDGKYVVSGSYDFTIRVWNPFKNECLHVLEGHSNRVYSLLFDGNRIVSGSLDTTIIVWNVHTGAIIHKLTGHQSLTSGMQIKGDILVSGNADSTVKIWSLKTGECMHTLSGYNKHMSAVTCLAFNEKFVVSSSDDGTVKLWNLETGEFIRNLLGLDSGGRGGVVWRISMHKNKLVCAVGSRIGVEETKLILLDFDWPPLDLAEKSTNNSNSNNNTSSLTIPVN